LTALADAGVALPTGWLWEDEGTYSRTTYANLFAAVTTTLTGHIFIGSSSISARSPALSAKASKAVEGAGIPTSSALVAGRAAVNVAMGTPGLTAVRRHTGTVPVFIAGIQMKALSDKMRLPPVRYSELSGSMRIAP